jgi:hypothetical protein
VRYRRYYSHENPGGSTTVTSYGPITTGARKLWRNVFGTCLVFFVAFCLLSPWSPGSNGAVTWALCWGFLGAGIHLHAPGHGCKQLIRTRKAEPTPLYRLLKQTTIVSASSWYKNT